MLRKVVAVKDKSNHLSALSAPPWKYILFKHVEKKMDQFIDRSGSFIVFNDFKILKKQKSRFYGHIYVSLPFVTVHSSVSDVTISTLVKEDEKLLKQCTNAC